jgi:lysozyme
MRTSIDGVKFLAREEGCVLCSYQDSVGVWTIGVGHTAAAGYPDPEGHPPITAEEALLLLKSDLGDYEDDVVDAITQPMEQWEFDAFVSFHYNTGAIGTATLTELFNAGDKEGCADAFMNWTKAGSDPDALEARRAREKLLFETGDYQEPFEIAVWDDYPGSPRSVTV